MKLNIQNFKCWRDQDITIGGLTLLAGANSAGKSSVIQSLLLARLALEQVQEKTRSQTIPHQNSPAWKGNIQIPLNNAFQLMLGNTQEVLNREAMEDRILLTLEDGPHIVFDVPKPSDAYDLALTSIQGIHGEHPILQPDFYYLSAERIGPRLDYRLESQSRLHVGYDGAFTIQVLRQIGMQDVDPSRAFDTGQLMRYQRQIELWMEYIVPGVELSVPNLYEKVRTAQMNFGTSSPTNVGFGVSYVLPIVVNGMLAKKGALFIVENPEAHLHPSGQSRIGQFLAHIAEAGVQVLVETHSEHVINGIRIAVLEQHIRHEKVIVNFFSKPAAEIDSAPFVKCIALNEHADLDHWPKGFFDQQQEDIARIFRLRKQKKHDPV